MNSCTVQSLWRYPVKSMGGEELEAADVTERGLQGDRAFALIDPVSLKVGSAKSVRRFSDLLMCSARFEGDESAVHITLPDGSVVRSSDADAEAKLAARFGEPLALRASAPEKLLLEFAAGTVGGKMATMTEVELSAGAPAGTFFDYSAVHLVTTATLRALNEAYPQGNFDLQRFRPNLLVDCGGETGFVENAWVGHDVKIGNELVLRILMPCLRCVMTTLARPGLPLDPGILKTAAKVNRLDLGDMGHLPCVGVSAEVIKPGRIQRGDAVTVL